MAITVTIDSAKGRSGFLGGEKIRRGTLQLGVYATNGIAVAASDFKLKTLRSLYIGHNTGTVYEWDKANGKIKAYSGALAEVANTTDISARTPQFVALGT